MSEALVERLNAAEIALRDDRPYAAVAIGEAAEADKARLSEALTGLCDWIENEVGAELPFDARAALSGSGSGWRE